MESDFLLLILLHSVTFIVLVYNCTEINQLYTLLSYSVCGPVIDEVIVNPLGGTASVKPTWLLLIFALLYVAVL